MVLDPVVPFKIIDAMEAELWGSLLYRNLDSEDNVLERRDYLEEAHQGGALSGHRSNWGAILNRSCFQGLPEHFENHFH